MTGRLGSNRGMKRSGGRGHVIGYARAMQLEQGIMDQFGNFQSATYLKRISDGGIILFDGGVTPPTD